MPPTESTKNKQAINDIAARRNHEHSQKLSSISRSNRSNRAEARRKPNHTDLKKLNEIRSKKIKSSELITDLSKSASQQPVNPTQLKKARRILRQSIEPSFRYNQPTKEVARQRDVEAEIHALSADIDEPEEIKLNIRKIAIIFAASVVACILFALITTISVDRLDNSQNNNSFYSN
ncbi:hypothetical protein KA529_03040 [Candidatus Saccharibacteria bacterium]|nr:hypothetical protein [Candidatus Saccharibacteria bacterium]